MWGLYRVVRLEDNCLFRIIFRIYRIIEELGKGVKYFRIGLDKGYSVLKIVL